MKLEELNIFPWDSGKTEANSLGGLSLKGMWTMQGHLVENL